MTHEHASDVQCQSAEFLMACLFVLLVIFGGSALIRLYYSIEDTSPPVVAIAPMTVQPAAPVVVARFIAKPVKHFVDDSCYTIPGCEAWMTEHDRQVNIGYQMAYIGEVYGD